MPTPLKPMTQKTGRQSSVKAPRQMAAARPATKSILTRAAQPADEEVSQANLTVTVAKKPVSQVKRTSATAPLSESGSNQSFRRSAAAIPHNPLR